MTELKSSEKLPVQKNEVSIKEVLGLMRQFDEQTKRAGGVYKIGVTPDNPGISKTTQVHQFIKNRHHGKPVLLTDGANVEPGNDLILTVNADQLKVIEVVYNVSLQGILNKPIGEFVVLIKSNNLNKQKPIQTAIKFDKEANVENSHFKISKGLADKLNLDGNSGKITIIDPPCPKFLSWPTSHQ
jgi:hypothetical protein